MYSRSISSGDIRDGRWPQQQHGRSRVQPSSSWQQKASTTRTSASDATLVINTGRKQTDLVSRGSFNEAHGTPRHSSSDKVRILRLFVRAHRFCAGLKTPFTFG